ncbi:spermidine/putrescine ABC transporter substrate-binding protein [uncultured Ruminococcus sp.]|uniref:ABC transporter substrate-binding protein n=1 Tax=uncultured Ruminococcus sp. TaxID=165186 RepID=UPI00292DBC9B|nr:spermidine/putrescine ABC transporter substrate-binding protein [uncultured Ruminococcus sp.]
MKRFFLLILSAAILLPVLALSACSSGNSGATGDEADYDGGYQGEVNVYNWGEYVSPGDDGMLDVIAEFQKRYHIKVNYTNFETNEELYNVLTNSNSTYDVIFPSDYMAARLREEGMLAKLDFSNIPNYKYIDDRFKNMAYDPDNEYSVPYTWGFVAIGYNTKMIEEGSITGFKDMWDPKYKDDGILMFNNSRDAMAIAMQLCDPPIDPGSTTFTREDIDRATQKLIDEKPVLKKYVMDQVFTEMEGSQSGLCAYYAGDIMTMMDNNEDLAYCLPEEGSNLFNDAMCIPANCKNKENAELFINFMCEPEIAAANAEYICYGTPNTGALELLDEEIVSSELFNPPQEYLDKCYTFSNIDDDIYAYMQKRFVEACSASAEVSSVEKRSVNPAAVWGVGIILLVIIIATVCIIVLDIRRAVKNRGRIFKR